jgi:hypothetical protein
MRFIMHIIITIIIIMHIIIIIITIMHLIINVEYLGISIRRKGIIATRIFNIVDLNY